MAKQTRKQATAREAYEAKSLEVEALIMKLADQLAAHREEFAAHPTHWGYVGDLGRTAELLSQAIGSEVE